MFYIYIYIYMYLKCTHQDVSSGVSLDAEIEPYQKLLTRLNSLKYIHCFISQNLGPLQGTKSLIFLPTFNELSIGMAGNFTSLFWHIYNYI